MNVRERRSIRLKIWRFMTTFVIFISVFIPVVSAKEKIVYVVPIEDTVENGLLPFWNVL